VIIYDSAKREKVEFKSLDEREHPTSNSPKLSMYVCGPTVYDKAHLGHGRSAVSFDVIRRYFEYKGNEVTYVSNYTDIDDKMINRAREEGITVPELAAKIIPIYEKDYEALGIKKPTIQPKATDHIKEIIEIIEKLEKDGYTYALEDGLYYDISKFKHYGELSGQNMDELQAGARVDVNDNKKGPYDFVLWKLQKEADEPAWKSPWGMGRPGWHIECSAMTWKHLGEKFDIHGGGLDLKFPHHECEVAQSVGAFGKGAFAQYFMHNGFIQVNNEKMSKSLGNFFTLEDIFKEYDPQVVRFMFLQTHYRNPINFSDGLLEQAKAGLDRVHGFVRMLEVATGAGDSSLDLDKYKKNFDGFMDNDFDTSGALGVVFDLVKDVNTLKVEGKLSKKDAKGVLELLKSFDEVLGIIYPGEILLDGKVEHLIAAREEARKNKDYKKSDEIRAELLGMGIVLEDTPNGTIWKKA
jgi:cysteinyl-tRNA synthetase